MKSLLIYYLVFIGRNRELFRYMLEKRIQGKKARLDGNKLLAVGIVVSLLGFVMPNISSGIRPTVLHTGYAFLPEAQPLALERAEDPVVVSRPRLKLAESSVDRTVYVIVTAYSSTPDQTDDTPFITATGNRVQDGIVAANFLPFGTKVMFPDYSGKKIYFVDDRMNRRFPYRVDIWMETRQEAENFGIRILEMQILK